MRPNAQTQEVEKAIEKGNILNVSKADQFKTVSELFEKSQSNSVYYTLLILSIFIVATGLLLGNAPIVIGGMLVTPVLTPILVIGLSITVGELSFIKKPGILILKSLFLTIGISAVMTVLFGATEIQEVLVNDLRTAILYFIVATTSGVAATIAWVRKQVSDILPGISIAVSLVPPLSLVGIKLGMFDIEYARFYLIIFALNFLGILIGSFGVFTILKFQKSGWEIKKKIEETEQIDAKKEAEKKAEKAAGKMEQIKKNIDELAVKEQEKGLDKIGGEKEEEKSEEK